MDKKPLAETNIQSFIVKIWLGEARSEDGRPMWRGYITHVPSGRRKYLKKLDDVTDFMSTYIYSHLHLRNMKHVSGFNIAILRGWVNRLKQSKKPRRFPKSRHLPRS